MFTSESCECQRRLWRSMISAALFLSIYMSANSFGAAQRDSVRRPLGVIQSGCGAQSIALREPFNTQSNALRSGMEAALLTYF